MSPSNELSEKLDRVQGFLVQEGLGAILLNTQRNFAWLTCGGSNHVGLATPDGVAILLVLRDGSRFVITPNNETARITDEETSALGFKSFEVAWHELRADPTRLRRFVADIVDPETVGSDSGAGGFENVESRFAKLRYRLTQSEVSRYRDHGVGVATAIEETARAVKAGMTEREIEALLAFSLMNRGARPTVLLVAADDRFRRYRHPIPTDNRVSRYVALSTCARSRGLTVAVTRLVHVGTVPDDISKKYRALQIVEAHLLAATTSGASSGEIFAKLQEAYELVGFPSEWREHHQGGATGYLEREWVATPGGTHVVEEPQAFAWNPTIAGTKIEDTVLATTRGIEVLSSTGQWPCADIEVGEMILRRPEILVR